MGIIGIIGTVLSIAKLIWEIWKMIQAIKKSGRVMRVGNLAEELRAGIQHYKNTGDSGPLLKMREELKEKCSGIACPPGLKE